MLGRPCAALITQRSRQSCDAARPGIPHLLLGLIERGSGDSDNSRPGIPHLFLSLIERGLGDSDSTHGFCHLCPAHHEPAYLANLRIGNAALHPRPTGVLAVHLTLALIERHSAGRSGRAHGCSYGRPVRHKSVNFSDLVIGHASFSHGSPAPLVLAVRFILRQQEQRSCVRSDPPGFAHMF